MKVEERNLSCCQSSLIFILSDDESTSICRQWEANALVIKEQGTFKSQEWGSKKLLK